MSKNIILIGQRSNAETYVIKLNTYGQGTRIKIGITQKLAKEG